jgi:hypothetical protein
MNPLQLIGAINAQDGSRLKVVAMRSTMGSQSCGSVRNAPNEDENQP